MKSIIKSILAIYLFSLITGCASLEPSNMVPYEQMGIPKESAIKSLSVDKVSLTHNEGMMAIKKDNSAEVKEALTETLQAYRLLNSTSNKKLSASFKIINKTKFIDPDFDLACEADYSIKNDESIIKNFQISSEHITNLNRSEMWKAALVAGITAGVATNVKINTENNSKAIASGVAAGLATAALVDLKTIEKAKIDNMPEPGIKLTQYELQQLDQIAFAREGTPITALDGTQRMKIAMENCVRKNFAMLILKILNNEIEL